MKTKFAIFSLCLGFSFAALAGATNDDIKCEANGKTVLSGDVPGDFASFDVTLTSAGGSVALSDVAAKIDVAQYYEDGVWTLNIERSSPYGFLQMHALPKTMIFKRIPNGYTASFTAKAEYNFSEVAASTQTMTLKCTLRYQL